MWFIITEGCRLIFDDFVLYGQKLREFESKGVKIKASGYREDIE